VISVSASVAISKDLCYGFSICQIQGQELMLPPSEKPWILNDVVGVEVGGGFTICRVS